jgi:VWFA-related protein
VAQEFTRDASEITGAFRTLQPRRARRTVSLDAVAQAVEMLRARPGNVRRVVLLIGEAKDRGSDAALDTVLEKLQRENVQLFAATYSVTRTQWTTRASDRPKPSGGENDIIAGLAELVRLGKTDTAEALAHHTGGKKLSFATLNALESIVSRVGEELHGQYLLSFAASGPEGFHPVTVALREPGKRAVAARQGYWAVGSQ